MKCRICQGLILAQGDPESGAAYARSVCVCWITGMCTICDQGPIVQEVYDATFDDYDDPDIRCRAHRHADGVEEVVHQPHAKMPEEPLFEHIEYEIRRDPRTYTCTGCGKNYKSKNSKIERSARGWSLVCPHCGSPEYTVKNPAAYEHLVVKGEEPPYRAAIRGVVAVSASATSLRKRMMRKGRRMGSTSDFTE